MILASQFDPVSFTGNALREDRMRFIYIDEAGTSKNEPVCVVAGIMFDADKHWRNLEDYLFDVKTKYVGKENAAKAIFHAKEVFNGSDLPRLIGPF